MKSNRSQVFADEILIGSSPEVDQIRKSLTMIGRSKQHVLVVGEAGTEKMAIAHMVFAVSALSGECLVETDAAKLNAAFDYEISSQIQQQVKDVNSLRTLKGTMIVENIDQLSVESQKKMTVFAKRGYFTLGNPVQMDFRLICTTSTIMHADAKQPSLDSELFLSLSELTIKVPSLKERRQDIPVLFEHYLKDICQNLARPVPPINFEIFHQMLKYEWPGNVKELENVVRSLVLSSPESELLPQALPFFSDQQQFNRLELQSLGIAVARLEKELIERALRKFAGNQSRAAQVLNVSEPNLRFKMKKLGIHKQDFVYGN
jgi:DNA-binding NtrC family response regulator